VITEAIYNALVLINLLLICGSFWLGPKLTRACRVVLLLTAAGLCVMLYYLVTLLEAGPALPGYILGVKVLLVAITPLLLEFLLLLWIYRKRLHGK